MPKKIWVSGSLQNLSFSLHLEKSAQKAFAVLRMIRRTFSRITRTDFQILYGAYVRPLLEYANPVVYSGRTKDVILIERVQRAATKMVAGLKSMDYETRLVVLDLFPLEYRRLRGDLILTYALFEQGLANRFFTVDPANTRRGHVGVVSEMLLVGFQTLECFNVGVSVTPETRESRFRLRNSGDVEASAVVYAGVSIVLSGRAESFLLHWLRFDSRLGVVRLATPVKVSREIVVGGENLVDMEYADHNVPVFENEGQAPSYRLSVYALHLQNSKTCFKTFGQPVTISALMLPSGGMAARHRKDIAAERSATDQFTNLLRLF
ncbi:hypothetical protein CLF_104387 [Clonorchis sinensis]|uniref:Pol-related protein n=1 Tax=Clonorchis sinensis TaxID=79923 RepID=G7YBK2_CLOSI|nr:hypothetical protein CLF_104387 [Clonorchis sinensis]